MKDNSLIRLRVRDTIVEPKAVFRIVCVGTNGNFILIVINHSVRSKVPALEITTKNQRSPTLTFPFHLFRIEGNSH